MADFIKGDPNKNIIPVFSSAIGKDVYVVEGPGIDVTDQSDANKWQYQVDAETFTDLVTDLSLVAKISTTPQSIPILTGETVDEVNLDWTHNVAVVSQNLNNNGGLTPPSLLISDRDYDYTSQVITANITFTLDGDNGQGQPGSTDSDTASITFGNYMWIGHGVSRIGTSVGAPDFLETFIESLATSVIKTARTHTYFATGGVNEKHFIAYPKAWGLATFYRAPFFGGYVRLKNVAGVLKVTLEGGDTETDIGFTNDATIPFAENYYIYESLIDNQNDPVTPFTIS